MSKNLLLATLPTEEKERLRPFLEPVTMEFKQVLVEMDKPIYHVWFPDNCVTSTVVDTPDGSTLEVGLMGIEGMVGLSLLAGEETSNSTVIAQVPGAGTRMRADHFMKQVVGKGGPLFRLLLRYTNAFMGMIAQSGACNTLHPLEERLCRWILMTHDRVQQDQFPLTQDFLSMMLGVRRPTVSMTASMLKAGGLIRYTRGSVTVLDRQGMEASSCECYEIINRQLDKIFPGGWREHISAES